MTLLAERSTKTERTEGIETAGRPDRAGARPSAASASRRVLRRIVGRPIAALRRRLAGERGDVPGWILISVMTAALVLVIWGLASSSFEQLWNRAMSMVDLIG